MKRQDLSRLEAVVRMANPIPEPDDLVDSDESVAVSLLVRQRTSVVTPSLASPDMVTSEPTRKPRRWRLKQPAVFDTPFGGRREQTAASLEVSSGRPFDGVRRRHRLLKVAAATVGLVALVVGVASLFPPSAPPPVAEQGETALEPPTTASGVNDVVPTTASGVEDVAPVTEGSLIAAQWTSHQLQSDRTGVTGAGSVAPAPGGGFVAGGSTWKQGMRAAKARLWHSIDGGTWEVVEDDATLFPEGTGDGALYAGHVAGTIGNERGVVAFGTAIWFSPDGTDWTVAIENVENPEPSFGLALESGGYLLYGPYEDDWFGIAAQSRVVFSADGINWVSYPTPVAFNAMVQLDSGQLVAAGGNASEPMTWTSSDGRVWSPLSDDHSISQGQSIWVTAMAAAGPGLVAGGTNADGEPTFWASVDGRTFQETASFTPAGPEMIGPTGPVAAIATGGGWIVAVGNDGTVVNYGTGWSRRGAMWVSRDGLEWEAVPIELLDRDDTSISDVTYNGSAFVAVGHRGGQQLVLRWEPPSP